LTYDIFYCSLFTYSSGQVFSFSGDDDVWVYINDRLVIDLGGLHVPIGESVTLNSATLDTGGTNLNLVPGQVYSLDMFHAERHCCVSCFLYITENLLIYLEILLIF
jgi:fibro-slime domain-containing protein